ncbi:MAG: hypoxanthine phosphoribosyltransferase [candidate division Zixibacteria bacterium]|nr:hypoxanthine phosphoribosyltransferase [candidate division Zixibacteria bacterium]
MSITSEEKIGRKPFELLFDQRRLATVIAELADRINADYADQTPVLLGVLKGCFVFMADLIRQIQLPVEVEFVSASSYRHGTTQESELAFNGPLSIPLTGRHVLIVEAIVDTGRTVDTIRKRVDVLEPASVEVVTLIDKPASHRVKLDIKYKGFSIGNEFVIGFGLDNTQRYRNLPFVGKMIDLQ